MAEETRYWGLTDAEREAALSADSAARTAAGWRISTRRTEFAFGKPGMNLVVTWVRDAAAATDGASPGSAPELVAQAHFDLNAAIAAATRAMPDEVARPNPGPTAPPAAPTFEQSPAAPPDTMARAAEPAAQPAPAPEVDSLAETQPTNEAEVDREPEPGFEPPADRFEHAATVAPTFTAQEAIDAFGPNGADVVWLLDALANLDRETAAEIASAYTDADEATRDEALRSMTSSFSKPPYARWMKAAEDLVASWAESVGAIGNDEVVYDAVASAAIDAVDALIVQDELDPDAFNVFYEPWRSVMEPADGDAGADEESAETEAGEPEAHGERDVSDLGPSGAELGRFFDVLSALTAEQVMKLAASGAGGDAARLDQSWGRAIEIAAEKSEYRVQFESVVREVMAWRDGATGKVADYRHASATKAERERARKPVLRSAAGLLFADLLDRDDAERLYGPWLSVAGEPALPEFPNG